MTKKKSLLVSLCLVPLCLIAGTLTAQQPAVTSLMSQALTDMPGLEGAVVMQVQGGQPVTLTPGQTFYEGPNDVHIVGRNASSTQPAKFLVLLIKDKGAPVLVPVP